MLSKNGYGLVDGYNRWRNTRHEMPPVPFTNDQVSLQAGVLKVGDILGSTYAQGPPNAYTVIALKDGGFEIQPPGIFKLEGSPGYYTCYYVDISNRQDIRTVNVTSREGYQLSFLLTYSFKVTQPEKVIFINSLNRLWVAIDTAAKNIARECSHDTLYPVGSDTRDYSGLSNLILEKASRFPINKWITLTELEVTDVIGDPDRIHAYLEANLKNTQIEQEDSYIEKERDLELKKVATEWMVQSERDEIRKAVAERDAEIFDIQCPSRLFEYQRDLGEKFSDQVQSVIEKSFEIPQNSVGAQGGYLNAYGMHPETMREMLRFADRNLQRVEKFNLSMLSGDTPDYLGYVDVSDGKSKRDIYAEVKELQEEPWSFDVRVTKKNGGNFSVVIGVSSYQVKLIFDGDNPQDLISGMTKIGNVKSTLPRDLIERGAEQSIAELLQSVALYLISTDQVEFVAGPNGSGGAGVSAEGKARTKERSNE
jgi:hypothetical protein